MSLKETWHRKPDSDLEIALTELDQYEPSARDAIVTEARLRGITIPPDASKRDAPVADRSALVFSKDHVLRAWKGNVGLAEAFWLWAVGLRLVLDFITVLLAFTGFAALMIVPSMVASVGWAIFATVAVFRSAEHYEGWGGWKVAAKTVLGFACVRRAVLLIAVLDVRPF
jgi:hypothetical protein